MTRWKWDADPNDPLVKMRIPVASMTPLYPYIAVFHKESPHRPTEAETRMIRSFIDEHVELWLSAQADEMRTIQSFDTELGRNPVIFHKYGTRDWGYRRAHWQVGSMFTPPSPRVPSRRLGPMALAEVMDLIHDGDSPQAKHWREWRAARPEVFE